MPFDTSMYANYAEGSRRNLSDLVSGIQGAANAYQQGKNQERQNELQAKQQALQEQAAQRQQTAFETEQADAQRKRTNELFQTVGQTATNLMSIQDPQAQQAEWLKTREGMINSGLAKPQELPELFEAAKPMVGFYHTKYQQAQAAEAIKRQTEEAQLAKIRAETGKANADAGKARSEIGMKALTGEHLPLDAKKTVETLATKNANGKAVKSEIDAFIEQWPNWSESDRLAQSRMLIKTLNSTQGQDAVGAEEVKRLASKLQFAAGNFTNDNEIQWGRNLDGFFKDVQDRSNLIGGTITRNGGEIDRLMGRSSSVAATQPGAGKTPGKQAGASGAWGMDQAHAGEAPMRQEVKRQTKDGRTAIFDSKTKQFVRYE